MNATVIAAPLAQGDSLLPHKLDDGAERRYVRGNQEMSKRVYRAQVVRQVFGAGAARMFMRLMQVDAGVAQRVLRSPVTKLRR